MLAILVGFLVSAKKKERECNQATFWGPFDKFCQIEKKSFCKSPPFPLPTRKGGGNWSCSQLPSLEFPDKISRVFCKKERRINVSFPLPVPPPIPPPSPRHHHAKYYPMVAKQRKKFGSFYGRTKKESKLVNKVTRIFYIFFFEKEALKNCFF